MLLKVNVSNPNTTIKKSKERIVYADSNDELKILEDEILKSEPTSYIISGYRGVGKTTFISRLKENINLRTEKKHLFVMLNQPKYESHSIILRKLIRQLYITYEENLKKRSRTKDKKVFKLLNLFKRNKNTEEVELEQSLKLLFLRTFNNIEETTTFQKSKVRTSKISHEFNINKLIRPLGLLVLSLVDIRYEFLSSFMNMLLDSNLTFSYIFLVVSIIWGLVIYRKEIIQQTTYLNESLMSSLYDDEIAEFRLRELLVNINNSDYKPIFVFDELDKLNNIEEMEILISELKSIMLSNLGTFIFITGQSLYYQFNNSSLEEDSLIGSVFSKTIHVPLLTVSEFKELFKKYFSIDSMDLEDDKKISDYIHSQIFKSNRVTRTFINLIKQDIHWEGNDSYLNISKENTSLNAVFLESIDTVVDDSGILEKYDQGICDFFITQLHKWVKKMLRKNETPFNITDIFDNDKEYENPYHVSYLRELNQTLNSLVSKLIKNELLIERKEELYESESLVLYQWAERVWKNNDAYRGESDSRYHFLNLYITFESLILYIYNEVLSESTNSIIHALNTLIDEEILNDEVGIVEKIDHMRVLRNNYIHYGTPLLIDKNLSEYTLDLINYKRRFMIDYYRFIFEDKLNNKFRTMYIEGGSAKLLSIQANHRDLEVEIEVSVVDYGTNLKEIQNLIISASNSSAELQDEGYFKDFLYIIYNELEDNEMQILQDDINTYSNPHIHIILMNNVDTLYPKSGIFNILDEIID